MNKSEVDLRQVALREGVEPEMLVCGNCEHYVWGEIKRGVFDRHCGSCKFQSEAEENNTISIYFVSGNLHALTGAELCPCYSPIEEVTT
jgi:hypothetical protein